jgi:hypothetical protein
MFPEIDIYMRMDFYADRNSRNRDFCDSIEYTYQSFVCVWGGGTCARAHVCVCMYVIQYLIAWMVLYQNYLYSELGFELYFSRMIESLSIKN